MKTLLPLLVVAAWFLGFASAHAQAPTPLDDYRRAVETALGYVRQASARSAPERAPLLQMAREALAPIRTVRISADVDAAVDNTGLLELVRDADKTSASLERLAALRDALAETPATIRPADLTALHNILNRPPFANTAPETWWQTLIRSIVDFLERLAGNTANGIFDARDIFVGLGVLAVLFVVLYFVRNLRRNLVSEEALAPLLDETEARTPGEAFDKAQRFVNAGDYRNAVRQLYLATLLILDQRGKIKYDPTLTNRQVLQQASNDPGTTTALEPIVETFDRVWYGFEPLTRGEFDVYRERVEKVRE
jgi:hypothetical protein